MARAVIYRGSKHLNPPEAEDSSELDSIATSIKMEPGSPLMGPSTPERKIESPVPSTSYKTSPAKPAAAEAAEVATTEATPAADPSSTASSSKSSDPKTPNRYLAEIIAENEARLAANKSRPNSGRCHICHLPFANETQLRLHHARTANPKFQCHICRDYLDTPEAFVEHRKSAHNYVTDERKFPYHCDSCPLKFCKKNGLQCHYLHYHNGQSRDKPASDATETMIFRKTNTTENSARSQRKRRRDQLADDRERESTVPSRPGPKSFKDRLAQRPQTPNANRPLVQIHAIPQEVEALLSDHDETPMKKRHVTESHDTSGEEVRQLRSGQRVVRSASRTGSRARVGKKPEGSSERKTDRSKSREPSTPAKLPPKSPSISRTPLKPVTLRKWAALQQRFDCKDCFVSLENLESDRTDDNDSNELDESAGRSIGVQLKNLEIALKKLDVPDSPRSSKSKRGKSRDEAREKSSLYKSSICRTRFTSKQKLIHHYLCFHTNSAQDECGVCKTRCGTSKALKSHLLLHCIKITWSKLDRSPIDAKGPCERYKKKYTCVGCKKRFWLMSCLKQHEELCRFVQGKKPQDQDVDETIEVYPRLQRRSSRHEAKDSESSDVESSSTPPVSSDVPESETLSLSSYDHLGDRWWDNKMTHGVPAFPCSTCNTNFKTHGNLLEHQKRFSQRDPKRCEICGTLFPSRNLHYCHVQMAHISKSYKIRCLVCDQGFSAKKYLRSHLLHVHYEQIHNDIEEWKDMKNGYQMECKVCKLVFQDRKRFIEHCVYYTDDEVYICSMCNKKFNGKFRCHSHWKTVHYSQEMQKAYTHHCSVCNEGFMYKSHMDSHMFHIHDQQAVEDYKPYSKEPFVCSICEQKFATAVELREHENAHSNDGKYECHKCERKCRSELILSEHLKASHSNGNEIPQGKCPSCGEGLLSKSSWISHIKHVHEESDCHPSEFCLENFSTLKDLVRDTKVQEEEYDPLDCIKEPDEFNELNVEDEESVNIEYTCAICDDKFLSMDELKQHKTSHTSEDYGLSCLDEANIQQQVAATQVNQGRIDVSLVTKVSSSLPTSMEMSHVSFVSPQTPDGSFCTYYAPKDMPCNFSITNIYSVNLEEYERLNNQFQDSHHPSGDGKTTEAVLPTESINFHCNVCGTRFPCSKTLQNHMTRYSNTGDHVCDVCGRRFKWIKIFRSHVSKHRNCKNGVYPLYYCERCDEAFTSKDLKLMHFAHIHNEPVCIDNYDTTTGSDEIGVQPSAQVNSPKSQTSPSSDRKETQIEQVDLTEDEDEEVNVPLTKTNPVSATVKPTTAIQPRVQSTYRSPIDAASNICPIVCNICQMQCTNLEVLGNHFNNAHGIQLSSCKTTYTNESTSATNQDQTTANPTNYGNNQESRKSSLTYQLNRMPDEVALAAGTPVSMFYYCKSCRFEFGNEKSLLAHLQNKHGKNETVTSRQDNWNVQVNSSDTGNSLMSNKMNERSSTVTVEASFVGNDNERSDSGEDGVDGAKKKQNVVLSKIDLPHDPDRPYHILRGTDAEGKVQYIRVPKKDLVNFKLQRVTSVAKSEEDSSIH